MDFYTFAGNSPFLTFFLAWFIYEAVTFISSRTIRHLNIRKAGWPPEHLDADGDFKSEGEKEDAA